MNVTPDNLLHAIKAVCFEVEKKRMSSPMPQIPKSENILWTRLVECILGSQVTNSQAICAANWLSFNNLMNVEKCNYTPWQYVRKIQSALRCVSDENRTVKPFTIRFFKSKARLISDAYKSIYINRNGLNDILDLKINIKLIRRELVKTIPGIGPKQASLFLRNVYFTDELAILDTHILKFINHLNICSGENSVSNIHGYEFIENRFKDYFRDYQIPIASVDYATWIVMREAAKI